VVYTFELMERIIHGHRPLKLFYDERCRDYSSIASDNMIFFTNEIVGRERNMFVRTGRVFTFIEVVSDGLHPRCLYRRFN